MKTLQNLVVAFIAIVCSIGAFAKEGANSTAALSVEALWGTSKNTLSGAGTIEEAITAAVNDNSIAYIQLQKDVTGTWAIPGGVFTFDLNSYTLSQQIYNVFNVSNEGTEVTFTDNSNGKTGKIVSNYYYDAEIDIVLAGAAVNISQGATVNFLEGCYEGGNVVETAGASTVNISGGTFNNTYYDGIINDWYCTLNITGGTFNSTRDDIIATYGGSVTISGGTFHLTRGFDKTIYYMGGGLNLAGYPTSEIKNITLISRADVSFSERGITLPNGYCFYNEDNMPVTGFVWGDYTIKEEPEALWGASEEVLSGAGTIEEAITAAVNDNSIAYIQLQKDVTGTWTIPGGVFTFDLNGYTMQKSWETLFTLEGCNTSVTFVDGSEHKTGKMIAEASNAIYIGDGARAEFQSGYYKGNIALIVFYGCSADITGGTFESAYDWCIKNLGTLAISGGDFIGGSSATIGVEGNTTVTGGNFTDTSYFATFYYYEDKLDLSGHTDAGGITIYNGSAGNIPLENENIVLPEGYILFDKNGDRATEIVQHTSYKLGHPCTVSFAAGEGGSGSMDDVITGEGFNYTLPECAFTAPKGKMFKAWLVNEVEYQAGSTVVIDSDITITAKWYTTITIDISDVFGDGWNGNSIIVKREGETIETVTIDEGYNGTVTFEYDPRFEYTFHWNRGEYSEECSFNILVNGIEVFSATNDDCSSFENEELVYASTVNMETYTIIDGEYTEYIGKNANVGTLTYIRTLPNTEWNSLYVPFEIPVTEELLADYEVAYLNDMHSYDTDDNGCIDNLEMEIIKIKGGTLRENYPYFIRAKNDEARALQLTYNDAILYRAKETTLSCSSIYTDFEIKGTYRRIAAEDFLAMPGDYHYAISVEGGWWQIEDGSALNPFRAYMTLTARDDSPVKIEEQAMRAIRFSVIGSNGNDGTTGIEEIKGSSVYNEGIYDLQGRKIDKIVEGGIYIINGKKVFVK